MISGGVTLQSIAICYREVNDINLQYILDTLDSVLLEFWQLRCWKGDGAGGGAHLVAAQLAARQVITLYPQLRAFWKPRNLPAVQGCGQQSKPVPRAWLCDSSAARR